MLAYSYKGQKCTTRSVNYIRNYFVIRDEIMALHPELNPETINFSEQLITVFYDCFDALVRVNNLLVVNHISEVQNVLKMTLKGCEGAILENAYLSELPPGRIIAKMREWVTIEDPEELKRCVVSEVVHWEKAGFVIISGCNRKCDAWSFSKYVGGEKDGEHGTELV